MSNKIASIKKEDVLKIVYFLFSMAITLLQNCSQEETPKLPKIEATKMLDPVRIS